MTENQQRNKILQDCTYKWERHGEGESCKKNKQKKETGLSLGYREMKIDTWLGEGIGVRFHKKHTGLHMYTVVYLLGNIMR